MPWRHLPDVFGPERIQWSKRLEHVLEPQPESEHGLLISRRASPECRGNFDGRAALAAFSQRDGVSAALASPVPVVVVSVSAEDRANRQTG